MTESPIIASSVKFWEESLKEVRKNLRKLGGGVLPEQENAPVWLEIDRLVKVQEFALTCLQLAQQGRLDAEESPPE